MKLPFSSVVTSLLPVMLGCTAPSPQEGTSQGKRGGGDADVIFVKAVQSADHSWTFYVTISHPDKGWQDYADGWDVVTPDGTILKPDSSSRFTRTLLHPHVNEQPFTRDQSGILIPQGVINVRVRAHDIVDGYGGQEIAVNLDANQGQGYEVKRIS